jgi:hypothetical protein
LRIYKTYTGLLTHLGENCIFVFGSNTQGRHGKGSALTANIYFGAIYGKARGRQGQSYAIVTKDLTKKIHPSIPRQVVVDQICILYDYALNHQELEFYIAYNGTNKNLNGYSNQEMAEMFSTFEIPNNIVFELEFSKLLTSPTRLSLF